MIIRSNGIRLAESLTSHVICPRCLLKLSRPAPRTAHRAFTSSSQPKHAVLASVLQKGVFRKGYFLSNSFLEGLRPSSKNHVSSYTASESNLRAVAGSSSKHPKEPVSTASKASSMPEASPTSQGQDLPIKKTPSASSIHPRPDTEHEIPLDASARLSTLSSTLPKRSLKRLFTTYLSLSKPRLSFLVVLTCTTAYGLYPAPDLLLPSTTTSPSLSALTLLFLTTGTALSAASANAFNMLYEPKYDAQMSRTRNRPLVRKLISTRGALSFAVLTGLTGVGALYYGVNPTVSFLGALNIIIYAGVYTPMKRLHPVNTWVGAIVGGIPPLMGWAAAAGHYATDSGGWQELLLTPQSIGGWLLGGLLFAWQFPHFNALSWSIRDEYKQAGYKMLAWINPRMNARVAVRYSLAMFPLCIGLWAVGVTDPYFVITSSVVNAWMTREAWRFWKYEGQKGSARALFWASVWHLPIVMVLALVHKKRLWEGVWRSIVGAPADEEDGDWEYVDEDEDIQVQPQQVRAQGRGHGQVAVADEGSSASSSSGANKLPVR
ncbi:MAG: hypothetical protein M1819_003398 [Sarea resinae]|nr:MAG: hypothetical protein M1819_003398 [Sarea resinae]